ncbi:hypothetical protein C8R43DRAFT_596288 [Mycena crocata]|nr:hypothetical protein C8R43DRAFT_596288 [Mycena crocata]
MSNDVPLTTHNLQREDRTRLIKSTRKIGDVVGETPHLVDISSCPPPLPSSSRKLRRSRQDDTQDSPSPPAFPSPRIADGRPLLYLRVPDSPPADFPPATPAPSPTLTVALNLRHISKEKDDAARRRKMAKLFRTLGVNVPTELVFPPQKDRLSRRLTARTLMSRTATPEPAHAHKRRSAVTPEPAHTHKRRSGVSAASRGGRAADPISRGWVWVGRRDEIPPHVRVHVRGSEADPGIAGDWVTVNGIDSEEREIPQHPAVSKLRTMHRKENGWSGEWAGAVENMDDVVRSLRGLKVK